VVWQRGAVCDARLRAGLAVTCAGGRGGLASRLALLSVRRSLVVSFAADYFLTLRALRWTARFLAGFLGVRLAATTRGTDRDAWLAGDTVPPVGAQAGRRARVARLLARRRLRLALLIRAEPNRRSHVRQPFPLSAAVLAGLRLVPLYERLSLWIVPALYVGLGVLRRSVRQHGGIGEQLSRAGGCGSSPLEASWVVGVAVVGDVGLRGIEDVRGNRPRTSHHQLDDRAAVRALIGKRINLATC